MVGSCNSNTHQIPGILLYFLNSLFLDKNLQRIGVSIIEFEDQMYVKVKTVPHFTNQLLCF